MTFRKIYSLMFLFYFTINNICFGCESPYKGIAIDNGLMTMIPAIITSARYQKKSLEEIISNKTRLTYIEHYDLNSALKYHKKTAKDDAVVDVELFCPIIIRENTSLFTIKSEGQFREERHKEFIEACQQNKAIYYPFEQGIFVYNIEKQPSPYFYYKYYNNYDFKQFIKKYYESLIILKELPNKKQASI